MSRLTHSLSAAHFAELGAGYGSAACLAVLRGGQASRRLLLLRAIADADPAVGPALELLSRTAKHAPHLANEALSHPMLGVWATDWLRGRTRDPGYLSGLAASAAVRAGVAFHLPIQTVEGTVALPTLGTAVGVGDGTATITGTGHELLITGPAKVVLLMPPFGADRAGWQPSRRVSTMDHAFDVEDLDRYRDCFSWPPEQRLSRDDMARFGRTLDEAWKLITARHPYHAEAMRGSLRMLVPLATPPTGNDVSAASRLAFGAIGVRPPDHPETLAELLIHEFQHMKLGALLDMVQLHAEGGPAIHCAPWRADARPVGPLLQGTYAHLGVTGYWRSRLTESGVQSRLARFEFGYWLAQTSRATATLAGSGELTQAGVRLVDQMGQTLQRWRAETVPDEISAIAEDVADSAVVLWRLRNQTPAEDDVSRAVAARRDGMPCPPPGKALAAPGTAPGAAQPSALATMLRRQLIDPSYLASGQQSDVAYTFGDYSAAVIAYEETIRQDPEADEAWAGLALALRRESRVDAATAMLERPDLVREVCRRSGESAGTIACWLSPTARVDRYHSRGAAPLAPPQYSDDPSRAF